MENVYLTEWHDAVNCATELPPVDSQLHRYIARVYTAGEALARDYCKAIERADREAALAVRLRMKLHEVAGSDIASGVE